MVNDFFKDIEVKEVKNGNGVSVSMVDSGSPAEKNGLEVRRCIKSMNGRLVSSSIEFKGVLDFSW